MRQLWKFISFILIGSTLPSSAALQFVNVSSGSLPTLGGAAYDGADTFLAVGTNATVASWKFAIDHTQTNISAVPGPASLLSAAYGSGMFLAGGTSASIFESPDGVLWVKTNNAFQNPAAVLGLAFNPSANRFAAVASVVEIYESDPSLNWSAASLPNASFLESFRAVVPTSANGFAACGIFGDIRLSSDGGFTWTNPVGHSLVPGQLDLLGISSDGANRLVAVGTNGIILFSSTSGSTWSAGTSPTTMTLNGAAFDSGRSEFVAVGDQGTVFSSSNGITWGKETIPGNPTSRFRAVIFANRGDLQGVGLLVGENGTAFLAGSPPAAAITNAASSKTNCSYSLPNPALTVNVVPDATHPAGTVGVDWYDTRGNRVWTNSLSFSPPDTVAPPDAPAAITYFAQTRDLRTGFTNASPMPVTLTLYPRPTAAVTGTNVICNGESTLIQAALTGVAPWTVVWSSNGIPIITNSGVMIPNNTITVSPVNPLLNNATNVLYSVSAVSDFFGCGGFTNNLTGGALITINPRPTASVTGTNTICNGQSTPVHAALTGLGPTWTVTWTSNGVPFLTHTVATRTDTVQVSPVDANLNGATNALYVVSALTDQSTGCTNNQPGDLKGGALITINPRPTAVATGTNTICNGDSTMVQASLTGLGPTWTVTWTSNGVPFLTHTVATRTDTVQVSPVDANPNGATNALYVVSALTDQSTGCTNNQPGDLKGGALITINPRPTAVVTGTNTICNGDSTIVQAALTGLGPTWTVTWTSNGVPFLTHTVATRTDTVQVSPVDANLNGATNALYVVSALTDQSTGCTNNQPGDLKGGALITINPRPTAVATGTNTICNGDSTMVQASLTGLGPTWTVTWTSNGVPFLTHTVATRTDTVQVSPVDANLNGATNALYVVSALTDQSTGCTNNQPGDLKGGALITINPRPTAVATGTNTICNGDSTMVQASLTGLGPTWTVTWTSNGVPFLTHTVVTRTDTVQVSPVDANPNGATNALYVVSALTDQSTGCTNNQPGDLKGGALITINPRPTAVATGTNTICNGDSTMVQASLTGLGPTWTVTWTSNGVPFLTHTVVTRTDTVQVSPVDANPNGATNALYVVSALIDRSTGCTNNQPGDLTGGALVTINPRPTALVTGTNTICNGQSTPVHAALTGLGPTWTVTWSSNGVAFLTHTVATRDDIFQVTPVNADPNGATNALYQVTALMDVTTGCTNNQPGDLTGGALVTINPRPTATVTGTNTICNGQSTPVHAALTGLGPTWTVTWSSNGVPFLTHTVASRDDSFQVTPLNADPNTTTNVLYAVTALTDVTTACTNNPLGDLNGGALITVRPNTAVVTPPASLTNCPGTTASFSVNSTGTGLSYQWYKGTNPLPGQTGATLMLLNVSASDGGIYSVLVGGACGSAVSNSATLTVNQTIAVTSGPASVTNCLGSSAGFSLTASGTGLTYQWYKDTTPLAGQTASNLVVSIKSLGDAGNYSVVVSGACGAPVTNSATLTVNPLPSAPASLGDLTNCVGVANPSLSVTVTNGVTVDWYDNLTNGVLVAQDTPSYTPTNIALGSYTYYAEARSLGGCPSTNRTAVTLLITNCPLSIANNSGKIVLEWFGNMDLRSSTNLTLAVTNWTLLTNGYAGVMNFWTNSLLMPQEYFRLTVPGLNTPGANAPALLSIRLTNNVVILDWVGNSTLQSTATFTNDPSSTVWINLTRGNPGAPNHWTNSPAAPEGFFRLRY